MQVLILILANGIAFLSEREERELNLSKRVFISIQRQKGRFLLLLGIVFLLMVLVSGSIATWQAIINTEMNLRRRLPAIATISLDQERVINERELRDEWFETGRVPASMIREIGDLPYVRMFDYTAWGYSFFSEELVRVFSPELFLEAGFTEVPMVDIGSLSIQGDVELEQFTLKGVHEPSVIDIEAGLIHLTAGRTFAESEVYNGSYVAIISQNFLEANQLYLGGFFTLDYNIYSELSGGGVFVAEEYYTVENLILSKPFELEIIGVFEHTLTNNTRDEIDNAFSHIQILNQIYVPNRLVESTVDLYIEAFRESQAEFLEEILAADDLEEILDYENIMFLLYDPTYLINFKRAANAIIPEYWTVHDLSNAYADISSSMEMLNDIANLLLFSAIGAVVVILNLLILLFVRDRKEEIGIYLALGEKRIKIVWHMILEVMVISFIAISMALFVGHFLASEISTTMIRNDLASPASDAYEFTTIYAGTLESMGFHHEMTHEEMLASHDVSLNITMIVIFYAVALGSILLAILVPITYITRLNPKRVLL